MKLLAVIIHPAQCCHRGLHHRISQCAPTHTGQGQRHGPESILTLIGDLSRQGAQLVERGAIDVNPTVQVECLKERYEVIEPRTLNERADGSGNEVKDLIDCFLAGKFRIDGSEIERSLERTRTAHTEGFWRAAIARIGLDHNNLEIPQAPRIINLFTLAAKKLTHGMAWINALAPSIVMFKEVPRGTLFRQSETHLEDAVELFQRQRIGETNLAVHLGFRTDIRDLAEQGASGVATIGADLRQICDL